MSTLDETLARRLAEEHDGAALAAVWTVVVDTTDGPMAPSDFDAAEAARADARTDAAWADFSARVLVGSGTGADDDIVSIDSVRQRPRSIAPNWALRAAAGLILAVGGVGSWYAVPVTHEAPRGTQSVVALPDGSSATLNAGSELRYRRSFSLLPGVPAGARRVRLSGEAFFDVASLDRPFEVDAGSAVVRVLGTRFAVRARDGVAPAVRVSVEEGSVGVRAESGGGAAEEVVLAPGQTVRVSASNGVSPVASVPIDRVGSWRSGGLAIVDESLADIVDELSIRLDTSISLAVDVDATARMSVYYGRLDTLESVLADLSTQQGLRYRRTADGWEIF